MAGDGVNDAPALTAAHVSFALAAGSGADVADITLMRNDLSGIVDAMDSPAPRYGKIRQKSIFAFIYNVLGIPLAALGMLNPAIAGAAMVSVRLGTVALEPMETGTEGRRHGLRGLREERDSSALWRARGAEGGCLARAGEHQGHLRSGEDRRGGIKKAVERAGLQGA